MCEVLERQFSDYDLDLDKWHEKKPFGISGCFRLKNEEQFMTAAVLSHLPYLDEAVLAVQPSTDKTMELAVELSKQDERVRVYPYPVETHFIDTPEFFTDPLNSIYSFVYFSNWALSKCRYSWIAKTEGDVICLSSFQKIVDEIKANPDRPRCYGRVILNVAGEHAEKISATNPRNGGWDECVVWNNPDYTFFTRRSKWEVLDFKGEAVCMGWSGLHMKRCKKGKEFGWNNEVYIPFDREHVRNALRAFNAHSPYPGTDNPLGEDCLFEKTLVTEAQ